MSTYDAGYIDGKEKARAEIYDRLAYKHLRDCKCDPCNLIRDIRDVADRRLWGAPGQPPQDND